MLVSGTEPPRLKELGEVSGIPERYGCDFLITAGGKLTGVQRKKFPEDLIASLADGRLVNQLRMMEKLDRRLVILEGRGQWTVDGELVGEWSRFTQNQLFSILFSLAYEFGVLILWVSSIQETITALTQLEHWAAKPRHDSLMRRTNPPTDGWGKRSRETWLVHFLQGFPPVGPVLAQNILDHWGGTPPIRWMLDGPKDLEAVPGIGKGRAKQMWDMLNGADGQEREDEQGEGA